MHQNSLPLTQLVLSAAAIAIASDAARSQTTFSIDYKGPTIGAGPGITEGMILSPTTGLPALAAPPPPVITIPAGPGGLGIPAGPGCIGHPPGVACGVEVDALSYGADGPAFNGPMPPGSIWFSVDPYATGFAPGPAPDVFSEGFGGASEAGADVFIDLGVPPGPPCGGIPFMPNTAAIDGNGLAGPSPFAYPGLGIVEPLAAVCALPETGDNLDALNVDPMLMAPIFYSLDAPFADVCGLPLGGSAPLAGFSPSDVIGSGGGLPFLYAPAGALGLDLVGGFATDDLDALAIFENGIAGYQPSALPYDWLGGGTDMLLFSVRAGSAVIGMPDSACGIPIAPGDILTTPIPTGLGGVSPFPAILYGAESLGLATFRIGAPREDELDALDVLVGMPLFDCNGNGTEDAADIAFGFEADCNANGTPDSCETDCNSNGIPDDCDISSGFSVDCNMNGIPDECDPTPLSYCTAGTTTNGCVATSSGIGIPSASAAAGFTVLFSSVEGNKQGIIFYGVNGPAALAWGAGTSFLCVKAPTQRTGAQNSGGTAGACDGTLSLDWNAYRAANPGAVGQPFSAGDTVWAQGWFRDPPSPKTTNLTDGLEFTLCP